MKQLSLDIDSVKPRTSHAFEETSNDVSWSISNSDIDQKRAIIQRYLDRAATEAQCSVNEYQKSRSKKKYFRVSWRDGKKMKHLHVPGGNVNAILAQYRARQLREMIDRGAALGEVVAQVQTYAQGE